jgi:hypothetical protein
LKGRLESNPRERTSVRRARICALPQSGKLREMFTDFDGALRRHRGSLLGMACIGRRGRLMRKTSLFHRLVLPIGASALFLAAYIGGAGAQESVATQVAEETREACTPDAMRLCSDYIPDVPKIISCMEARFAEISAPCRAAMIHEHYTARARFSRPRVLSAD